MYAFTVIENQFAWKWCRENMYGNPNQSDIN